MPQLRPFQPDDVSWLVQRHQALYRDAEGFDDTFGPLVASVLADFVEMQNPQLEQGFIAQSESGPVGSIFCVRGYGSGIAKLRLFFVEPDHRGTGLGPTLLHACLAFARRAGYRRMRLATHESHRAACALYARTGFVCTRSMPVHSFGVDLVEQTWELDLAKGQGHG